MCCCDSTYTANWKQLEISQSPVPVQSLLGDDNKFKEISENLTQWTKCGLELWYKLMRKFKLEYQMRILTWIGYDSQFLPAQMDKRFQSWTQKGITAFCSITSKGEIQDFQNLKIKYDLEKQDFYRFLQVRHYYDTKIRRVTNDYSPLIDMFIKVYNTNTSEKRLISGLYNCIQDIKGHSTQYIKEKWEKEMQICIPAEEWLNLWHSQCVSSSSRALREFCWKNTIRFFITPKVKAKQKGMANQGSCWRQCGTLLADHVHVFWSCPVLNLFWSEIHSGIEEILEIKIEKTAYILFLGNIPDSIKNMNKYLLRILLAAAKKAITRLWLQQPPPTRTQWEQIVTEIYKMERLTFRLRLQEETFKKHWGKWTIYISKQREVR